MDGEDYMANPIQRKRLVKGEDPKPHLHIGPIASSDTVMKSAAHRDDLVRRTQIIGFEMEGSGICNDLSCIIIKGVCDYADFQKNKVWQDYAAASAACAAKSFLEFLATNTGECKGCEKVLLSAGSLSLTMNNLKLGLLFIARLYKQVYIPPILDYRLSIT